MKFTADQIDSMKTEAVLTQTVEQLERIFPRVPRAGFTIEEIFNLTKIDRWFLVQIKEIVGFEEALAGAKN